MKRVVHKIASWFLKRRIEQVTQFMSYPHETQLIHFQSIIDRAKDTEWGRKYGYKDIRSVEVFRKRVPIQTYEDFYPYIKRTFSGEANVIWPGKTLWFAKSSGTTNDNSKFIPVSEESLAECHFKAGQDMLGIYFNEYPDSKLFTGKSLSIGGSLESSKTHHQIRYGDVSAVIVENLPIFYELMRTPSKEVAMLPDWDQKMEVMIREVIQEDVTSIAGVPTWTILLICKLLEQLDGQVSDIRDIWPNLELYVHGGVSFEPYRKQFKQLIPYSDMNYMEVYNASEGFFAMQNEYDKDDMLLMLDYGIFYEFIPMEHIDEAHPPTHTLDEVELGRNYAIVISTNGGLWRYIVGDTVVFTEKYPYKIKITGRTKHFINAFGEELMVDNAERAVSAACEETGAIIENYTAAPIYFNDQTLQVNGSGGHEWLIEFLTPPNSLPNFKNVLDETLKALNTDYKAKRAGDLALGPPLIRQLPPGTFYQWMKKRGRLGGQNKVPRLSNNRQYIEDILQMMSIKP